MSNDELYYDALTNLAERVAGGLQNRTKPLDELSQALSQLQSSNTIQGQAADNMKAYIGEVHLTLIQTLQLALNNFEMALGKYVHGYLEVDSNSGFQLVREDLEAHQRNLTAHRSDFTNLANQLKAISDEAEDIVWLAGAGGYRLTNVANEMDVMKQTASDLMNRWNAYEQHDPGFDQVQDLLARTRDLIKSTLKVPRGYSYSPGSFSNLMSPAFLSAYQANMAYAQNAQNQKEFSKDWESINNDYNADQKKLLEERQKEANQHKGFWEVVFGVAAVALGAAAIIFTAGAATPLVALAWTAGLSAGAYGISNVFEGSQIMVTGADKAFNPLRDTIFGGNQTAYDTFGNVSMFAAGAVIPVGAALNAGRTVTSAVVSGVGRTLVTTVVGAGVSFGTSRVVTHLAENAGVDSIWANDFGTAAGFGAGIFAGGKSYEAYGKATGIGEPLRYYSNLEDTKSVGAGKDFTATQKRNIIAENMKRNGGVVKSDKSGEVLVKPQKSQKGITPPDNEWQIDHIDARSTGGTNSYSNAQVLSRAENRAKSANVESPIVDKSNKAAPLITIPGLQYAH